MEDCTPLGPLQQTAKCEADLMNSSREPSPHSQIHIRDIPARNLQLKRHLKRVYG